MPHGIYPMLLANSLQDSAGRKWQPSNGTEGDIFIHSWCGECARDKAMCEGMPIEECDDNERCDILGRSFLCIDDPDYPTEWCIGRDGQPCCTAYVPVGEPIPDAPDTQTIDMFEQSEPEAVQP